MLVFASIIKWITDPRNRTIILFILIALLVGLFFYQRSRTQKFKYELDEQVKETTRITNNWKASQDSLIQMIDKNGILIAEKSGYELTVEELKNKYNNLFSLYKIEKNKPPKTIVEVRWKYRDSIIEVPTYIQGDSLITMSDTARYDEYNWRIINAEIPFRFSNSKLITSPAVVDLSMGMSLGTALFKDPKTGEIRIQVKTPFEDITFQDIKGAEIMSSISENKKVARSFRKEFGIGVSLGVGMYPVAENNNFKIKFGPVLQVGVTYTPRWLQFGPSQKGKNTISDFIDGN